MDEVSRNVPNGLWQGFSREENKRMENYNLRRYGNFIYDISSQQECKSLVKYNGTLQSDVELPEIKYIPCYAGMVGISEKAFANHKEIESIVVPRGYCSIDAYAFENCENLENITLSEDVQKVDALSFKGCDNLRVLEISKHCSIDERNYQLPSECRVKIARKTARDYLNEQ